MKLYKKIHILRKTSEGWAYCCSTNWSKTCRDAKTVFLAKFPQFTAENIKTTWARD